MEAFKAIRWVGAQLGACMAMGLLLLMASVATAARATCRVEGAGESYGTLQAAVNAASAGDTLKVKGTCYGDTVVSKSLKIVGRGDSGFGSATLNGGNNAQSPGNVIVDHGAAVAIMGLTITGGYSNDLVTGSTGERGGGIYNEGGSLTLIDSMVTHSTAEGRSGGFHQNETEGGGGIYNAGGSLTLTNSTVADNTGRGTGGGIYNAGGAVVLASSTVASNFSMKSSRGIGGYSQGGGIYEEGGSLTLVKTTITANRSAGDRRFCGSGGGIYNRGGPLTLTDSTLTANQAEIAGGGIDNEGSVTLKNSTVTGNMAFSGGGGLVNGGSLTLNNSDVARNAAGYGGGVENGYLGSLRLNGSSSVTENTATEHGGGIYNNQTGRATITYGIGWSGTVSGNKPDDIFNF
jgi:hypothetical protein